MLFYYNIICMCVCTWQLRQSLHSRVFTDNLREQVCNQRKKGDEQTISTPYKCIYIYIYIYNYIYVHIIIDQLNYCQVRITLFPGLSHKCDLKGRSMVHFHMQLADAALYIRCMGLNANSVHVYCVVYTCTYYNNSYTYMYMYMYIHVYTYMYMYIMAKYCTFY